MQQIGDHEEPLGPLREIWRVELAKHQWGHKLDYGAKPFQPQVGQDSSKALVRRRNQAVGSQDGVAPAFKLVSTRRMSTSQGQVAALSAELAKLKMLFDRQEVHVATYEDQYAKSNNKIKSLELLLSIAVKAAEAEHKRATEYFNLAEPEIKELRLLEAHWQKAAGAAHADYAQLHSQMNWTRKCLQDAEARAERAEQAAATAKAALKVVETDLSTAFYQLDKAELEVAALSVSQQQLDCPCSQEPSSTGSHAQLHSTGSSARNRDGQYEFPTGRWSPDFSNVDNDGLDQGEHSDAQCVHNSNQDQPGSPCLGPAPVNNTSQGLNQPGSPRLGPAPVENTSQALDQLGSPRLGPAPVDNTSQGLDQPGSPCLSPAPVDNTSQGLFNSAPA